MPDVWAEYSKFRTDAVAEAVKQTIEVAKRRSDGPLRSADRRRDDYPYASRHGAMGLTQYMPEGNPAIINAPAGAFRDAWRGGSALATAAGVEGEVVNDNPVGKYLDGTVKMVKRPIERLVAREADAILERLVDEGLEALEL